VPAGHRLVELARSPTSAAALVMIPLTFLIAMAVLAPDRRLKLVGLLGSIPLLFVGYLTYTRTVYLALWTTAVIVAWRVRRAAGVAILVAGVVAAIVVLPSYIRMRGDLLGGPAVAAPGQQLIASDAQRITAWATSIRMALDKPLTGQGYRSYRQVGVRFGADEEINAPHNEWLRLFAENGFIVGIAGLAFVGATTVTLWRRRDWLGTGILVAFVSIVLAACFNNPFLYNQVMLPAFIVTGTGLGLAVEARRTAAGPSPPEVA
jgi:O-antigen ligase